MKLLTVTSITRLAKNHRAFATKYGLDVYLEPSGVELPEDFSFFPTFLNRDEQRILFLSALRKLDNLDSREAKNKRKGKYPTTMNTSNLSHLFLPDEYYNFEGVRLSICFYISEE